MRTVELATSKGKRDGNRGNWQLKRGDAVEFCSLIRLLLHYHQHSVSHKTFDALKFKVNYPEGKKSTSQIFYDINTIGKLIQPIAGLE